MPDLTDFMNLVASAEDFGADGREPQEMKRFTTPGTKCPAALPVELHRRIRAACARRGLKPSSVLRDLLEREFPETSGQIRLRSSGKFAPHPHRSIPGWRCTRCTGPPASASVPPAPAGGSIPFRCLAIGNEAARR